MAHGRVVNMPPPFSVATFVSLLLLSACASAVPSSRLAEYVPPEQPTEDLTTVAGRQNLQAALVIISEMTAPEGSSPLPDEAMRQVADNLQAEISRALPVSIQDVLYRDGTKLKGRGTAAWQELAKETKHPYLALVVMSSTEQEYPVVLKVGGDRHAQPGLRRDNWSLVEFALLDVKNGKVLLRTEARGWATLDRPTAPDINQFYPVIYLRPQEPDRRVWPPAYEGSLNTLRVVSLNQAAKRLGMKLQNIWGNLLQQQASARGID